MENQLLEAMNYIKTVSKTKPSVYRSFAHINNSTASNLDKESVDILCVLRAKGIIDKHFKILLTDNTTTPASKEDIQMISLAEDTLTPRPTNSTSIQTQTTLF